jgi:hypothetical protein
MSNWILIANTVLPVVRYIEYPVVSLIMTKRIFHFQEKVILTPRSIFFLI